MSTNKKQMWKEPGDIMKKLFHNIELNESKKLKWKIKTNKNGLALSQALPKS